MDLVNVWLAALLGLDSALCLGWCAAAALQVLPGWPGLLVSAALGAVYVGGWLAGRAHPPVPALTETLSDGDAGGLPWGVRVCLIPAVSCLAAAFGLAAIRVQSVAGLCALVFLVTLFCLGTALCVMMTVRYEAQVRSSQEEARYREEMNSFLSVIRSQRHDYNFHVQTLAEMIRRGDMEECTRYVDELSQDSIRINAILPVKDAAISAMINSFRILAAREGIPLHLDIQNDLEHVVTNAYETNKVVSNLLQNAIDEVKTHPDRSYGIWLQIMKRGEYCVIRVSNEITAADPGRYVEDVFRQGYTTKSGHDGVGLASVKMLLKRYRGVIYSQVEGDVICFIAKIPLTC